MKDNCKIPDDCYGCVHYDECHRSPAVTFDLTIMAILVIGMLDILFGAVWIIRKFSM